MMTVSAVAKLMPRPPARVDKRKQNAGEPGAVHIPKLTIYLHFQISLTYKQDNGYNKKTSSVDEIIFS
jgi:hypothetical protein